MNTQTTTRSESVVRDRPPILAFLLLFAALLAVVTALAALNEAPIQTEPAPAGDRPESHPQPNHRQEKAS